MSQKFNKYGKRRKPCRKTPIERRRHRQALEEKMTEEERVVASRRFQKKLQEMDAKRLQRPERKFPSAVVIVVSLLFVLGLLVLQGDF